MSSLAPYQYAGRYRLGSILMEDMVLIFIIIPMGSMGTVTLKIVVNWGGNDVTIDTISVWQRTGGMLLGISFISLLWLGYAVWGVIIMNKRIILYVFILPVLAFFEMLYLFGSLDGICHAFCVTSSNILCPFFSVGMFLFGLAPLMAWFPKYEKPVMASLSLYFSITLLASLCWARWVPALSFAGLTLSLIAFRGSMSVDVQSRDCAERLFFGLALSVFLFLSIDDVFRCVGFAPESALCSLLLLGLLSVPLRIKCPCYSSLPLLLYFILRVLLFNSEAVKGLALFGLGVSVLALVFAFSSSSRGGGG